MARKPISNPAAAAAERLIETAPAVPPGYVRIEMLSNAGTSGSKNNILKPGDTDIFPVGHTVDTLVRLGHIKVIS